MNKLYSEFAVVTRIKFPFFPWPNLIFYKPYVTSRNGPLMHNTTAYTSHIQNRNTWVIVDYHNELWENSKSSYTFVWATEKNVQELLSKSVHLFGWTHNGTPQFVSEWVINTLRPRQNCHHFADDIFKCIFLNENVLISLKISLKFVPMVQINNIPALVLIMAWRRPGDKPLSEPMMVCLLTQICVTRPQWVKFNSLSQTADIEVQVVHISCVIINYALELLSSHI